MIDIKYNTETKDISFIAGIDGVAAMAYVVVDRQTENSVDVISAFAFNTVNNVAEIMVSNALLDSMMLPVGMVLKVPNIDSFRENTEYKELLRCDIETLNNGSNSTTSGTNVAPNVKQSVRKNYTKTDNGIFIF